VNVIYGLVLGTGGNLYPREADFPCDYSGRLSNAQEALACRCLWDGDNVPHSWKPNKRLGCHQRWVQKNQDPRRQTPAHCNDVSTMGTVRWYIHQVEWGQQNHPTGKTYLAHSSCQVLVLWLSMTPVLVEFYWKLIVGILGMKKLFDSLTFHKLCTQTFHTLSTTHAKKRIAQWNSCEQGIRVSLF